MGCNQDTTSIFHLLQVGNGYMDTTADTRKILLASLNRFLKDILIFTFEILSTGLYGKTIQHFFVAKGVGGNGKSVINSLMMKCVGSYGYKLPSSAVSHFDQRRF